MILPARAALEPHSLLLRHRKESYAIYIYKTIDMTPLGVGIYSKAIAMMNFIERIATETLPLTDNQRSTSPPREVPTGAHGLPPVHQLVP